jgi:hypothetical protein
MANTELWRRVEMTIGILEMCNDRVHPLRRIPMDMVTDAVERELLNWGLVPSESLHTIASALNAITARNGDAIMSIRADAFSLEGQAPVMP